MSDSAAWVQHRMLQARCRHPRGEHLEITLDEVEQSIPARFERIVSKRPEHLAVKAVDGEVSYRELDEWSNRIAQAMLRTCGSGAEPVGVLVTHGAAAVAATLGVLKAGKFYVPLDPHYPRERLAYMLDDAAASLVVTDASHERFADELAQGRVPMLTLDDRRQAHPASKPSVAIGPDTIGPDTIAALFYTSGSTGRPKGIVYTHRYLLHNMRNYGRTFQVSPHDRWTWLHGCGFSPSSTDMFSTLLHGATLCPWNVQRDGLTGIGQWLVDREVTVLHWMASPFRSFQSVSEPTLSLPTVRLAIFGGEKLFARDLTAFREPFSRDCLFVNRLGASETGLYRVWFGGRDEPLSEGIVPAGYGIPDKTTSIVDEHGTPCRAGEIGEIVVTSRYLSMGYWRRSELTEEKFRPDPRDEHLRTYRTGDLGRLRPDGCLDYFGRKDSQVKVRGYRIETDEVESVLREIGGVSEAAVLAIEREDGDHSLAAYFVAAPGSSLDEATVRRELLARLPGYMAPTAVIRLEAVPRNANGKVDRSALPIPDLKTRRTEHSFMMPRTSLERRLVEVWESVLGILAIGVEDSFFELGGDSLGAMRIVSRLQPMLKSVLHVPPLFEHPTIATFAAYLEANYELRTNDEDLQGKADNKAPQLSLTCGKLETVREALAAFPIGTSQEYETRRRNPPAIFVLAPMRSGTTLLRVILGGNPALFSPPELHLLSHVTMTERFAVYADRHQRGRLDAATQALAAAAEISIEESECRVREFERNRTPVGDFYRELQALVAPRRIVDKTPIYAWRREILQRAESIFENPLYLHLTRHPYGMIRSYEELRMDQVSLVGRPAGVSVTEFAEALWLTCHENIRAFLQQIPERRQMRLSFEDLVQRPGRTIASLCDFLGLEIHPGMFEPYGDQQRRMTAPFRPEGPMIGDPKFHKHQGIEAGVADRWRDHYHKDFLCEETWSVAEEFGYSRIREMAKPSAHGQAVAAARSA